MGFSKNILKINIWGERDTEQMKEEKTQKSDRGQMKEEKRQKECSGESHCVVCLAWLVDSPVLPSRSSISKQLPPWSLRPRSKHQKAASIQNAQRKPCR